MYGMAASSSMGLLGRAQCLARRQHRLLGLARSVGDLESANQRLREGGAN